MRRTVVRPIDNSAVYGNLGKSKNVYDSRTVSKHIIVDIIDFVKP